jgi:hypothetical protein
MLHEFGVRSGREKALAMVLRSNSRGDVEQLLIAEAHQWAAHERAEGQPVGGVRQDPQ